MGGWRGAIGSGRERYTGGCSKAAAEPYLVAELQFVENKNGRTLSRRRPSSVALCESKSCPQIWFVSSRQSCASAVPISSKVLPKLRRRSSGSVRLPRINTLSAKFAGNLAFACAKRPALPSKSISSTMNLLGHFSIPAMWSLSNWSNTLAQPPASSRIWILRVNNDCERSVDLILFWGGLCGTLL